MALERRRIDVTLSLGEGDFGEGGVDSAQLNGFRTRARIVKAGGNAMGTAQVQIFGMDRSKMNKFSTLGLRPTTVRKNTITIMAGTDGKMATVFDGTINNAYADYQSSPEVPFIVTAQVGRFEAMKPVDPKSYRGSTDVATIMQSLASVMGKRFENNGVDVKLSSPYLAGTARDQAVAVVKAAGICWNGMDDGTLAIWPAGKARGGEVPLINADSGLVGFPSFTSLGIQFRTLFDPSIGLGGKVRVESDVGGATGDWNIYALSLALDAEVPHGEWYASVSASPPGFLVVA